MCHYFMAEMLYLPILNFNFGRYNKNISAILYHIFVGYYLPNISDNKKYICQIRAFFFGRHYICQRKRLKSGRYNISARKNPYICQNSQEINGLLPSFTDNNICYYLNT